VGKQHTIMLLEEWVPHVRRLPRDEALAELARRYYISHGPATLVPFDDINDVVVAFDSGQIDAMSGWDPYLHERTATGGTPLVTSEQLRIILDVVITSRVSIQNKPQLVQAFHNAWFDTLKAQIENSDLGAALIAAWGHNDWLSISKENAGADLRAQMQFIAQADLQDNVQLIANVAPICNQINLARRVWSEVGSLASVNIQTIVDPQFVLVASAKPELQTGAQPLNNTFSLVTSKDAQPAAGNPQPSGEATPTTTSTGAATETTLAVLPCRCFNFQPDSTDLSDDSRNVVNLCVLSAPRTAMW
jgi:hypothetical protein